MFLVLSKNNPVPPQMAAVDSVAEGKRGNALVLVIDSKWHCGSATSLVCLKKTVSNEFQTEWENNFDSYQSLMKASHTQHLKPATCESSVVGRACNTQQAEPLTLAGLSFKSH